MAKKIQVLILNGQENPWDRDRVNDMTELKDIIKKQIPTVRQQQEEDPEHIWQLAITDGSTQVPINMEQFEKEGDTYLDQFKNLFPKT